MYLWRDMGANVLIMQAQQQERLMSEIHTCALRMCNTWRLAMKDAGIGIKRSCCVSPRLAC